jgi:hypothetical protein
MWHRAASTDPRPGSARPPSATGAGGCWSWTLKRAITPNAPPSGRKGHPGVAGALLCHPRAISATTTRVAPAWCPAWSGSA